MSELLTAEERQAMREPLCRCGHYRDDHGSRTEQDARGDKRYVQKCEHCPCETFTDKDGPLSKLIDSFQVKHD